MNTPIRSEAVPIVFKAQDTSGNPLKLSEDRLALLNEQRSAARQKLIEDFPETTMSGEFDPAPIRSIFRENNFTTSPISFIPNTEKARLHLYEILERGTLDFKKDKGYLDAMRLGHLSIVVYSTELDVILFTEPSNHLDAANDTGLETEYARMTLGHELGHSADTHPTEVVIELDTHSNITRIASERGGFGASAVNQEDLSDDDFFVGSILEEGFAVLMGSKCYRPAPACNYTQPGAGRLNVPGDLLSHPRDRAERLVADGKVLSAMILKQYDNFYGGIIAEMEQVAKNQLSGANFASNLDARQPGLHAKLQTAIHESTWLAVAREAGIEVI